PSPVRDTVPCWCGNQRGAGTSHRRFCPTASVGSVCGLQSRLPRVRGSPGPGARAPMPPRPAAPGGDHVRGVSALCDNGVVWLWRGVWRLVCVGTSCTPVLREGLYGMQDAQAHMTPPPRVSVPAESLLRHALQDFLLFSVGHLRYI